ncbi:hypothetical protein BH11PLA2_BH11PLA2_21620 [soil metagenome]
MNDFSILAISWLLRTLFAGGMVLAAAWLLLRLYGSPARRERLAAWAIRGAVLTAILGLFPAWLTIPISLTSTPEPQKLEAKAATAIETATPSSDTLEMIWVPVDDVNVSFTPLVETHPDVTPMLTANVEPVVNTPSILDRYRPWVLVTYATLAALAILQLVLAIIGLVRLRRSAKPLPERVKALLPADAPAVLMSDRVTTPICFGWRKPTVLLPVALLGTASDSELRWVLAHELDHLRRGDTRTGLWVGLARAVYFVLPWFWALRRDLRLAQEYLADAAAAADRPADYAAFLVHLSGPSNARRLSRAPLAASHVRAGTSDLYRRVSMLTNRNQKTEGRVSRTWSLLTAGGILAASVGLAGLGFADDKKDEKKVEVEVIILKDDDVKKEKKDGEKKVEKRNGDKKAEGVKDVEKKDVIIRRDVMIAGQDQVQKLTKEVNAALEKGDVAAAKEAMAKLNKVLVSQPNTITLTGQGQGQGGPLTVRTGTVTFLPAKQVAPAAPQPPEAPRIATIRMVKADDEVVKKLEAKVESLKKALGDVKDNPEAREAMQKTIEEYRKKIAEARAKGELRFTEVAPAAPGVVIDGMPKFVQGFNGNPDPEHLKLFQGQMQAQADHIKDHIKKRMNQLNDLDLQLAEAKANPDRAAKIKQAMTELKQELMNLQNQANAAGGLGGMLFLDAKDNFLRSGVLIAKPGSGRLGISIESVPEALADQLDLAKGKGILITGISEGSVAAKAGLKANDILINLHGKDVTSNPEDLIKMINGKIAGEMFDIVVIRKGKKETFKDVSIPKPAAKKAEVSDSGKRGDGDAVQFNSMSVSVNNDEFTIDAKNPEMKLHVVGHFEDGKAVAEKVTVTKGDDTTDYKGTEKMPKSDRAAVEQLLKNVRGGR